MFKRKCLFHKIVSYETKKTAMFCSAKDSIPIHQKTNIIYKITCPGFSEYYIRKTDRNLVWRLNEHASCEGQPIYQHLSKCEHFAHIGFIDYQTLMLQQQRSITNAVNSNICVLGTNCNWSQLLFLEALYIKNLAPKINDGLKATRELLLFR